jgi:carboxymethylenebutenolidase
MSLGRIVFANAAVGLAVAGCGAATRVVEAPVAGEAPETTRASASTPSAGDAPTWPPAPTVVTFPSGALSLRGFLYRPAGLGPFPVVVMNHGSERSPSDGLGQAMFYVRHGYVLFVPHRRGQGISADAGPYVMDTFEKSGHALPVLVRELVAQSDDVMAAVEYVASLPYVDTNDVNVVGCSFGGIEALFAAERGTGIHAVVDFAGGAMAWSAPQPELRDRMRRAARNAKVPVFFVQAQNDYDTAPSVVLSNEMRAAARPMRVHIFPANGTTHREGHGFCAGGERPAWGDEVLAFLADPQGR